jgi:hypothetical protein
MSMNILYNSLLTVYIMFIKRVDDIEKELKNVDKYICKLELIIIEQAYFRAFT